MSIEHPENFDSESSIPIDDEYVAEILDDEFGIPDGIEDVLPRVEIARQVYALARGLEIDDEDKYVKFVQGLADLAQGSQGGFDDFRTMQIVFRLARMVVCFLEFCRDISCDEDDTERAGAAQFDEFFFSLLEREVEYLAEDGYAPYWDSSRARHSEGTHDEDSEHDRTFRFTFTCDVDCDSEEFALVDLAGTVMKMLEPDSLAPAWTMEEFADVVPLDDNREPVSRRSIHLGANSARLKGFLGLMEQSEFVFE
jgi:hypothetical protein